jgi:hypothetical protein
LIMIAGIVAVLTDGSSWYFTKLYHPFAWVVMCVGATMGLCFAFMWVVSMNQMWISPSPSRVAQRGGGESRGVG